MTPAPDTQSAAEFVAKAREVAARFLHHDALTDAAILDSSIGSPDFDRLLREAAPSERAAAELLPDALALIESLSARCERLELAEAAMQELNESDFLALSPDWSNFLIAGLAVPRDELRALNAWAQAYWTEPLKLPAADAQGGAK